MEEDSKRKLIFIVLIALVTVLGGFYILDTSNRRAEELLNNMHPVDTLNNAQLTVFDSLYRHHMHGYTIDVLKSTQKDYAKLIFRNDEEIDDRFVVTVSPMNDLSEYESDVIQRFIDIHEHEKMLCYEYTVTSKGTEQRRCIHPLTEEYNISIVHRYVPVPGGQNIQQTFIKRNKCGDMMRL